MTADSIPAPMVQLPAETVEKLREALDQIPAAPVEREGLYPTLYWAARAVLDAATPAGSVPAADILALADSAVYADFGQHHPHDGDDEDLVLAVRASDLRALVAAAEQADKGEGGQRGGKSQDTATPHEPSLTAPAAPPEPLCRCGHAKSEHAQGSFSCGRVIEGSGCELHVCSCSVFRYGSPARVPVNDEAEAQIADVLYEHMARTEKTGYIHGCKCGWSARPDLSYRAHLAAEIAARLADSRPVVSEAAIRACAIHLFTVDRDRKGLTPVDWEYANDYEKDFFTAEAKAALTAALPHMGDGKGEA